MRILVVQETDWLDRNPILHHRMLESLGLAGDEVVVLDYDILWRRKGARPLVQRRQVVRGSAKFYAGSGVVVVRPAMLRIPGLARPTWLATTTIELLRQFVRFKPDVVVAYGLSNALVARALAAIFRVPYVFHIFDALHAIAEPAYLAPIARFVEKLVLRAAHRVIVVHRKLLEYVGQMGVQGNRVEFIMNGFEVRHVLETTAQGVRRQLGIADGEVVILFVGWLYTHSGLLEVSRQLVSGGYEGYRLVVAGDGDLLPALTNLSQGPGGERLVVLGRVPVTRVPELIAAADVGLCSSEPAPAMRYIVPAKVDEYLEVGRPVLATRLPGMLAELGDVPGVIWIDGPEEALPRLRAVLDGAADPRAALHALGDSARSYGHTRESWEVVTRRFRAVLSAATGTVVG